MLVVGEWDMEEKEWCLNIV